MYDHTPTNIHGARLHLELVALQAGLLCALQVLRLVLPDVGDADLPRTMEGSENTKHSTE